MRWLHGSTEQPAHMGSRLKGGFTMDVHKLIQKLTTRLHAQRQVSTRVEKKYLDIPISERGLEVAFHQGCTQGLLDALDIIEKMKSEDEIPLGI